MYTEQLVNSLAIFCKGMKASAGRSRPYYSFVTQHFLSVKRIKSFNLQITHHHIGEKLRQQRKDSYSDGEWLYQEEIIVSLFFTYRIVAISEINIS